jgi:hypothetical protein
MRAQFAWLPLHHHQGVRDKTRQGALAARVPPAVVPAILNTMARLSTTWTCSCSTYMFATTLAGI